MSRSRALSRRAADRQQYAGFWAPMDTLKDKQRSTRWTQPAMRPGKVWELEAGRPRRRQRCCPPPPCAMPALRLGCRAIPCDARDVSAASGRGRILCLGAHCDDIEIGCGATCSGSSSAAAGPRRLGGAELHAGRETEARASAAELPRGGGGDDVVRPRLPRALLPVVGAEIKEFFDHLGPDRARTSSSPTRPTTCTRTTACSPSSP